METFRSRFCNGSGQTNVTMQDLDRFLAQLKWVKEQHSLSTTQKQDNKQSPEGQRQRSTTTHSILLLRDAIQAEHVPFTFDYLIFHAEC